MNSEDRKRTRQVLRWLLHEFPTGLEEVKLRIGPIPKRNQPAWGLAWVEGRTGYIVLSNKLEIVDAPTVLQHEYAHLLDRKPPELQRLERSHHDDSFWIIYGRIYRAWDDGDGEEKSKEF